MSKRRNIQLSLDMDVAWLIALWIATHGGDPGPDDHDELTWLLAQGLVTRLGERYPAATPATIEKRLEKLGIAVRAWRSAAAGLSPQAAADDLPRRFCINIDPYGDVICVRRPASFE